MNKLAGNILAMAIIDLFLPNLLTMLRYLDLNFFVNLIIECILYYFLAFIEIIDFIDPDIICLY